MLSLPNQRSEELKNLRGARVCSPSLFFGPWHHRPDSVVIEAASRFRIEVVDAAVLRDADFRAVVDDSRLEELLRGRHKQEPRAELQLLHVAAAFEKKPVHVMVVQEGWKKKF